jgi:hypothetical protein
LKNVFCLSQWIGSMYETGCNASSSTTEAFMSCAQDIFATARA